MEIDIEAPSVFASILNTYLNMAVDTLRIIVKDNRLTMSEVDATRSCCMTSIVNVECRENDEFGFPLFLWNKIKNKMKAIDKLNVDDDCIYIVKGKTKYKLAKPAFEEKKMWKPSKEIEYVTVDLSVDEYINSFSSVAIVSDVILFEYGDGTLRLTSKDENISASSEILFQMFEDSESERCSIYVGVDLLDIFKELIKKSDKIKIGIPKTTAPLYISPKIKSANIDIYIAPRIIEEE